MVLFRPNSAFERMRVPPVMLLLKYGPPVFGEPVKAPLNSMLLLPAMVYCALPVAPNCHALAMALAPLRSLKACRLPLPPAVVLSCSKPVPKADLFPIMVVEVEPRVVVPP